MFPVFRCLGLRLMGGNLPAARTAGSRRKVKFFVGPRGFITGNLLRICSNNTSFVPAVSVANTTAF